MNILFGTILIFISLFGIIYAGSRLVYLLGKIFDSNEERISNKLIIT